ncbi:unnamed protein product [Dicrocoelium dendriticum]|nr:unnamed protein product [Dicrocoelium dendriticum]
MHCRVEFIEESVTNPSSFLAKLNLLMPAEMGDKSITELTNLKVAKNLKKPRENCIFPVQIRQEAAFYVPSRAPLTGKPFEFTVIFKKLHIPKQKYEQLNNTDICHGLMNLSAGIITNCTNIRSGNVYVIASVQSGLTEGSVYEAQLQLMVQLNAKTPNACSFNVVPKTISKGY